VRWLLGELGGVDDNLLGKLPEHMTLYERRLAAYLRALLESPELLVIEDLAGGLGPTKRKRAARFAEVYRARCPGGTFVQFET
jgi:ABC-type molybdenum transport system ATPase subunit/photorepair protein PhrA